MQPHDPFATAKKPCKCHERNGADPFAEPLASAMPSEQDIESALAELGSSAAPESLELELAALDEALSEADAFELEQFASPPAIAIEDVLALVERYPGLKITFSS
jgi:hypothetical protein